MHIEFLLEEPSAEAFLHGLLPKLLPDEVERRFIVFQGKKDLLAKLETRLIAYRKWIPDDWRIVVLIDEDRENCRQLKTQLEQAARKAAFATKSHPAASGHFTILNRLAVEELEAWFFGDVPALAATYPGVSPHLATQAAYRTPDAITGGTWEALERVLQRAGHFRGGLAKIELARALTAHMVPSRNTSVSFQHFVTGLSAAVTPIA